MGMSNDSKFERLVARQEREDGFSIPPPRAVSLCYTRPLEWGLCFKRV